MCSDQGNKISYNIWWGIGRTNGNPLAIHELDGIGIQHVRRIRDESEYQTLHCSTMAIWDSMRVVRISVTTAKPA